MMYKISVFCEDIAHEAVIGAILKIVLALNDNNIQFISNRYGKGKAITELKKYLHGIKNNYFPKPNALVIANDGNCMGFREKQKELKKIIQDYLNDIPIVFAIPEPHIEKWLLLEPNAFKAVFGKGCKLPGKKCERDIYKQQLKNEIIQAGKHTFLGGTEYAEDIFKIVLSENKKLSIKEKSFNAFIKDLSNLKKDIHSSHQ